MTDKDKDALTRAMEMARREPSRRWQLDEMLKDQSWQEVAEFAAYHCQNRTLRLKPWESPPMNFDEDEDDDSPGCALLIRMLAAGLSRFEPDPLAALNE
jgi:hypothetical protein